MVEGLPRLPGTQLHGLLEKPSTIHGFEDSPTNPTWLVRGFPSHFTMLGELSYPLVT